MSHETYIPSTETLSRVDFATLELFKDQEKFRQFFDFEQQYSGKDAPVIVRDRGAGEVTYNTHLLAGITERCSHLIDVYRAHESYGTSLDNRLRYLVVTHEFDTGDTTEWYLYKGNGEYTKGLQLLLSHYPVHEVEDNEPVFDSSQSIEEFISAKGLHKLNHVRMQAEAIKFTMPNLGRATLSWGLGTIPETFVDMFSLRSQLQLLDAAQRSGQLNLGEQNHLVGQYLSSAA